MERFRAYRVEGDRQGFTELSLSDLAPGEILLRNHWSSLNYKDAMAVRRRGKILRKLPMVPGIDAIGTVLASAHPQWPVGTEAFVTGAGLGEDRDGGFSQVVRVYAEDLIAKPAGLSDEQVAALGTAGFTAMLCLEELELARITPDRGKVLVTGAGGGVGTLSVMLLAQRGYDVTASTGRLELAEKLMRLGANEVIVRGDVGTDPGKPLATSRWVGAIDTVGGETLGSILRASAPGACVCAVGLAGGPEFAATVYPFILRGVRLIGIDSSHCDSVRRREVWARLAAMVDPGLLDQAYDVHPIDHVEALSARLLDADVAGRIVLKL